MVIATTVLSEYPIIILSPNISTGWFLNAVSKKRKIFTSTMAKAIREMPLDIFANRTGGFSYNPRPTRKLRIAEMADARITLAFIFEEE